MSSENNEEKVIKEETVEKETVKCCGKRKGFLLRNAMKFIVGLATLAFTLGAGLVYLLVGAGEQE